MNNHSRKQTDFPPGLALALGASAGLAVGIFIAGKSGAKLRAEIRAALDEYMGAASDKLSALKEQGSDFAQKGLRQVQKTTSAATDKIKSAVSHAVDRGEGQAHGAIDDTVAAVTSAATKGHQIVTDTASTLRTGTQG